MPRLRTQTSSLQAIATRVLYALNEAAFNTEDLGELQSVKRTGSRGRRNAYTLAWQLRIDLAQLAVFTVFLVIGCVLFHAALLHQLRNATTWRSFSLKLKLMLAALGVYISAAFLVVTSVAAPDGRHSKGTNPLLSFARGVIEVLNGGQQSASTRSQSVIRDLGTAVAWQAVVSLAAAVALSCRSRSFRGGWLQQTVSMDLSRLVSNQDFGQRQRVESRH